MENHNDKCKISEENRDETKSQENEVSEENDVKAESEEEMVEELFDLEKLRLSQNFSEIVGVKRVQLNVPVRKPKRQEFVRVHPEEDMYIETTVLDFDEEGETYLIDPKLRPVLADDIKAVAIFTVINRQGVVFLWPIPLPDEDGRHNSYHKTALEAAAKAKVGWIKIKAVRGLKGYVVEYPTASIPDPEWPEETFQEILKKAFGDRFIDSLDHPVLRRLRGEL